MIHCEWLTLQSLNPFGSQCLKRATSSWHQALRHNQSKPHTFISEPLKRNFAFNLAAANFLPSCTAANFIGVPLKPLHGDSRQFQETLRLSTADPLPKHTSPPGDVWFDRMLHLAKEPADCGHVSALQTMKNAHAMANQRTALSIRLIKPSALSSAYVRSAPPGSVQHEPGVPSPEHRLAYSEAYFRKPFPPTSTEALLPVLRIS